MTQMTLEGKEEEKIPDCTCGLKKPWDMKYHYADCPWLKYEDAKVKTSGV